MVILAPKVDDNLSIDICTLSKNNSLGSSHGTLLERMDVPCMVPRIVVGVSLRKCAVVPDKRPGRC